MFLCYFWIVFWIAFWRASYEQPVMGNAAQIQTLTNGDNKTEGLTSCVTDLWVTTPGMINGTGTRKETSIMLILFRLFFHLCTFSSEWLDFFFQLFFNCFRRISVVRMIMKTVRQSRNWEYYTNLPTKINTFAYTSFKSKYVHFFNFSSWTICPWETDDHAFAWYFVEKFID